MIRGTLLTLIAAGSLIAAAVALSPISQAPRAMLKADSGYGYHAIRHVNRHGLDGCLSEPVECGLVVW